MTQINRLHGTSIELVNAYIAEYGFDNAHATVWVGRTESSKDGAELTMRMIEAIGKGNSGFSNIRRLAIAEQEVFQVDGPDGEHFFFNSRENGKDVIWLTVEAADTRSVLEEVLEVF